MNRRSFVSTLFGSACGAVAGCAPDTGQAAPGARSAFRQLDASFPQSCGPLILIDQSDERRAALQKLDKAIWGAIATELKDLPGTAENQISVAGILLARSISLYLNILGPAKTIEIMKGHVSRLERGQ